jgi:hypothetical protein
MRIFRIERHELVEEDMRSWCKTHWRTGVAGVCFEGGINLQYTQMISN